MEHSHDAECSPDLLFAGQPPRRPKQVCSEPLHCAPWRVAVEGYPLSGSWRSRLNVPQSKAAPLPLLMAAHPTAVEALTQPPPPPSS
jgi:hypothetical protein